MELPGQGYGWRAWGTPGMGAGGGGLWPRLGANSSVFLQGPPQGGLGGGPGGLGRGPPGKNIAGWAGGRWAGQGPPWDGSANLGGVLTAQLRDPWARPTVLPCPSQRGSWLAWRPWPQEETRPPSWQARLLGTSSRTREWKTASLKLRLFFLAIPEVDAAREVVWPRTRGRRGLPDQSTSEPASSWTELLQPPQATLGRDVRLGCPSVCPGIPVQAGCAEVVMG